MRIFIKLFSLLILLLQFSACASFLADLGLDNPSEPVANKDCDEDEDCGAEEFSYIKDSNFHEGWQAARYEKIREAIESNDVILGMTKSQVIESWGDPVVREVSGSGNTAMERWKYGTRNSFGGERYLIFENDRVTSWHR